MNGGLEKVFQFLALLPQQRLIMIAVGVSALWYFSPMYNDGSGIRTNIARLQADLVKEKEKEKETDQALKEQEAVTAANTDLDSQITNASLQLPRDLPDSQIAKDIDVMAKASGLRISKRENGVTKTDNIVETIPMMIRGQGTFSEVTLFFYYVSSLKRITRVTNFFVEYGVSPNKKDYNYSGELNFTAEIVSYRYVGDKGEEKKPTTGGSK